MMYFIVGIIFMESILFFVSPRYDYNFLNIYGKLNRISTMTSKRNVSKLILKTVYRKNNIYLITRTELDKLKNELVINKITGAALALNIFVFLIATSYDGSLDILIISLIITVLLYCMPDLILNRMAKEKDDQVNKSFSRFAIRFIILCDVSTVYEKVFIDAVDGLESDNYLFKALHKTSNSIKINGDLIAALESLSRDLRNQQVNQFINILIQSHKYGNSQMSEKLYILLIDILEQEKKYIIMKSEESVTKMIIPNMFMMVAIMMIIVYPGLQAMF